MRYPNIRAELARNGLTIEALANKMGISSTTLSNKLNGKQRIWVDEAKVIRDTINSNGANYTVDELLDL